MYLRTFRVLEDKEYKNKYPLNLKLFENTDTICFNSPLTIIMGDNGSGKSTLIKLIAEKLNAVKLSNSSNDTVTDRLIKDAADKIKISMNSIPKKKLLFQGEDFNHYLNQLNGFKEDALTSLNDIETQYDHRSNYSRKLARLPHERSLAEINTLYDSELDRLSHGQSFLEFFSKRISDNGLFIIDEPEAALSMENQLVFLNILSKSIECNSQIIISTHSPIIAAYPDAQILEIKNDEITEVKYEDISSINFLKSFLENKEYYLRYL